jgi:Ca2+-binding EF-hand superfamily protein
VSLAALAWPLAAATPDGNTPAAGGARAQLKQRLDTNHDGKIDSQECAAAGENFKANHPRLCAALLKKFDANGDGNLDEQERAAIRAKLQELRQKFDTSGDGKLDEQERAAAVENFKANHPRLCAALLKKFDTNGDGKLDEQERAAAREAIKARIQQRRAETGQK